ncbi:MAG: protein translocase subunit SecD [Gammaproteobacteria bacterium]
MQNRFPIWKNVLILIVFAISVLYALPNLYGDDPSVQISTTRTTKLEQQQLSRIDAALKKAGLPVKAQETQGDELLIRFNNTEDQLKAADLLRTEMGNGYTVALNLAPATPQWLRAIGAEPMYLGLDLRGGVHFLLEVDIAAALKQAEERYTGDIRTTLRNEKVRYESVTKNNGIIKVVLKDADAVQAADKVIGKEMRALEQLESPAPNELLYRISEQEQREIKKNAVSQNLTTLRNRINELGVAEPVIQQQGENRIVVQLPGVQDTARAKEILGATATLEFRLVDVEHDVQSAVEGRVPIGSRLYHERNGTPILLEQRIIVTGDQIVDAASSVDPDSGTPSVSVSLNGVGAKKMGKVTQSNIGRPMAVVFIEQKPASRAADGKVIRPALKTEEVINVATIRDAFSKRFQITGLDNPQEARNLALLLRAGALAAPIEIVEERTIGPSLGQDSIHQGMVSAAVGFALVVIFMLIYYKSFGLIADIALCFNLVLVFAVLSLIQATLTLPGIAGIALTMGMAVDANVLINERIKEELRNRNGIQASIYSGYEKAFATIFDSNITTLLAAAVLFGFGSGPVKGFAVTLSIGITASMFTAIWGTRMIVNFVYGNRRLQKLSI